MPLPLPPCLSYSTIRFGRYLTLVVLKVHGSIERFMFSTFHHFFELGIDWVQVLSFLPSPSLLLSCVCGLLGWWSCHATALLLLYHYLSFIFLLTMGLRAEAPASPLSTSFPLLVFASQHSCYASSLSRFLPLLGFIGPRSCCASPFHFLGFLDPSTSFLPLLLSMGFS